MNNIETMKLALEAFEWNYNTDLDNIPACEQWAKMLKKNIAALRQAIEQESTWVGLTDEELAEFSDAKLGSYDLCLEVEAKLKEKNT